MRKGRNAAAYATIWPMDVISLYRLSMSISVQCTSACTCALFPSAKIKAGSCADPAFRNSLFRTSCFYLCGQFYRLKKRIREYCTITMVVEMKQTTKQDH